MTRSPSHRQADPSRRWVLSSAALAVLLLVLGIVFFGSGRGTPTNAGHPLADFTLPLLGEPDRRKGPANWHGQVVVLNAWASWCIPCRTELPMLKELADIEGIILIGLNYRDDPSAAQKWLEFYGDPFQSNLVDSSGAADSILDIRGLPQTWVIDADGAVQATHTGALSRSDFDDRIKPLLARLTAEH